MRYIISLKGFTLLTFGPFGENRTHSNLKIPVLQTSPPTLTDYKGLYRFKSDKYISILWLTNRGVDKGT